MLLWLVTNIVLGLIAGFLWSTIFEYWVHRGPMHEKWGGTAFRRHVVDHHANRSAPRNFIAPKRERYRLGESAVPLIWVAHVVVIAAIALFTNTIMFWVSFTFIATLYFLAYEFLHHEMHQPHDRWYHKTTWFQFLSELHRIHHAKRGVNYNLVFPFGDWVYRTLCTIELDPELSAPEGTPRPTGPRSILPGIPLLDPRKKKAEH